MLRIRNDPVAEVDIDLQRQLGRSDVCRGVNPYPGVGIALTDDVGSQPAQVELDAVVDFDRRDIVQPGGDLSGVALERTGGHVHVLRATANIKGGEEHPALQD